MNAGVRRSRRAVRLVRVIAVAGVLAVAAGELPSPAGAASPASTAEVLLIGDSVLDGLSHPFGAAGLDRLEAHHTVIVDTAGCRRLIMTSCRIVPHSAPPNALDVLRKHAGEFNQVVVIATGYNDTSTGRFGIDAAVDAIMAEARRQGIEHVIWLTYREAGTPGNIRRYKASNELLRKRRDEGLVIADWAALSATLPADWFSNDGIHLSAKAVTAAAELIADALDALPPPRPPDPVPPCMARPASAPVCRW